MFRAATIRWGHDLPPPSRAQARPRGRWPRRAQPRSGCV